MNELDKQRLGLQLCIGVIESMRLNPKTKHLKPLTPEHRRVWAEHMEEMIIVIEDQIELSRKAAEDGKH